MYLMTNKNMKTIRAVLQFLRANISSNRREINPIGAIELYLGLSSFILLVVREFLFLRFLLFSSVAVEKSCFLSFFEAYF